MPAKSQAQFRAMQAAAHGHSTLGIPAKVGREFAEATGDVKSLPKTVGHLRSRVRKMRRPQPKE